MKNKSFYCPRCKKYTYPEWFTKDGKVWFSKCCLTGYYSNKKQVTMIKEVVKIAQTGKFLKCQRVEAVNGKSKI